MKGRIIAIILCILLVGCSGSNTVKKVYIKNVTELVEQFKAKGLSVFDSKNMEATDFGMAPFVSDEAMIFGAQKDEGGENMNGRVFKVIKLADLEKLKTYYVDLGKASAMLFSHTYSKSEYLIQMNGSVSKETFQKYVDVMNEVIK